MTNHHVTIKSDGTIEFLGAPPEGFLGDFKQRRFSEIVPLNPWKRFRFRVLRLLFGEKGAVAGFTRTWLGPWTVTILIGKHKGETFTHFLRGPCVDWERERWFSPRFDL